ncbi:MAG: hypothetical protein KAR45_19300 [Desulfobacteraceae bacterium]|nr:hypothetical protein [Desulfobacteraceae bacterium]
MALAFADKEGAKTRFANSDNPYSIKGYLDKAREILIERPELGELGRLIDNIR